MPSAEEFLERWSSLKTARGEFDDHWQELAERLLPRRADFTVTTQTGARRTDQILDSTPLQARRELASAMFAMLLPTQFKWFKMATVDEDLMEAPEVSEWFDHVEERMWRAIYDPRARFMEAAGETIDDLVTFGTSPLFSGTNLGADRLLFRSQHLRDTWIAENADGVIDTVYTLRRLTARQASQRYGPQTSQKVRDALRQNRPELKCEYLNVVTPRGDRDPRRADNLAMPWAHHVIDVAERKQVEESGFEEFPYAVPRWETTTDEVYGRSPGMLALPDVITLNEMRYTTLKAGQLATDPPIAMPNETAFSTESFFPGGYAFYDPAALQGLGGARNAIYPVLSGAQIPLGLEMENQTRDMIWGAFMRNVLRLPVDGPQMTATEILQRREEFIRVVGPVFARQEHDLPGAVVNRVFGIMFRAGAFRPPPDILRGQAIDFQFRSAVQQALERIEVAATQATLEQVAPLASVRPEVLDNFDADKIVRAMAEGNGMPHDHLLDTDDVAQIRAQRAQQQAAEAAAQAAERAAAAAGDAAPMVKAIADAEQEPRRLRVTRDGRGRIDGAEAA